MTWMPWLELTFGMPLAMQPPARGEKLAAAHSMCDYGRAEDPPG